METYGCCGLGGKPNSGDVRCVVFCCCNKEYMGLSELAEYLGYTYETVKSYRNKYPDLLPPESIKINRRKFGWLAEDVDKWVDEKTEQLRWDKE